MKATGDLEIQFAVSGPWAIGQPRVTRLSGPLLGSLNLGTPLTECQYFASLKF